jgi:hypothetical protein
MAAIVHGNLDSYVLQSKLTRRDATRGSVTTEVWAGLYSGREAKATELMSAGAQTVTPSKGGVLCALTAVFGNDTGSEGAGGGGGPVEAITTTWEADPLVSEQELKRLKIWGVSGTFPPTSDDNDRAEVLAKADSYIAQGRLDEFLDITFAERNYQYATLKAGGVTGYLRAAYAVIKTTTWANQASINYSYAQNFKVIAWSGIGAPTTFKEPQYRDVKSDGTWETVSMQWLTMPPRVLNRSRVWTLIEQWNGAREWIGAMYDR